MIRTNIAAISIKKPIVLPKNCMVRPDDLLEDFETAGDWTATSGSLAANTTQFKVGTQSIKLTTPSGGSAAMTKTISWAGLSKYEFLEFWYYLHDTTTQYTSWTISISSTTDFSKKFTLVYDVNSSLTFPMVNEWTRLTIPLTMFTNTGSEAWTNTMIRLRFECVSASGVSNISIDGVSGGFKRIPVILLYWDDGYRPWYTNGAFHHSRNLGIRASVYISCNQVRKTGGTTHLTHAQLREMHKSGWNISDHGYADPVFAYGTATEAAQEYALGAAEIYIRQHLECGGHERIHSYSSAVPPHNADTFTALANIQALGSRGGFGAYRTSDAQPPDYLPPGNIQHIRAYGSPIDLAGAKVALDNVILHGEYAMFGWDAIDGAGWTTATYKAFMDYIAKYVAIGALYVITPDELYRLTLGPVTIGGFQPQPVGPFALPTNPVNGDFDDGTMDYWDAKVDTASRLSVTAGAAMGSSASGLNIHCATDDTDCELWKYFLLEIGVTDCAYRFYFDPNSVASLSGTGVIFKTGEEATGYRGIAMYLTYSSSNYKLCMGAAPDSGTVSWATSFVITDAPHYIEMVLHRASTDGGTDGWAKVYVDGVEQAAACEKTGLANYNVFIHQNRMMIGYDTGSTTATGDFFVDQVKMNKTGTLIGA